MRKLSKIRNIVLMFSLLFTTTIFSQQYVYQFGNVTDVELEATAYPKDPTADAVIISDYAYRTIKVGDYLPWTRAKFPYVPNRGYARERFSRMLPYVVETMYQQKIKIFTEAGVKKAAVRIPYFNKKSKYREENIDKVEIHLYKLIDGEVEKYDVPVKEMLVQSSDSVSEIVADFSQVSVGDVVEYRYVRTSPLYVGMPSWDFQRNLPVMSALLETFFYDAFQYNMNERGSHEIKKQSIIEYPKLNDTRQAIFDGRSAIRTVFLSTYLPAFDTGVKYVWNKSDHITGVDFELRSTRFMGYIPYADKWKDVEEWLESETHFNKLVYGKDFFKKEVKALLKEQKTDKQKLEAIYQFVKEKIHWNGEYSLDGNVKTAIERGIGNNAEINAALIRALRTAKIYVYPVLISPRSEGRFPKEKTTFDKIKTFVVCASLYDGNSYYMDGSARYGGINLLPTNLLVAKGRTFVRAYNLLDGQSNAMVNLTDVNRFERIDSVTLAVEGRKLLGMAKMHHNKLSAYVIKEKYHLENNKQSWTKVFARDRYLDEVNNYQLDGIDDMISDRVVEQYQFQKTLKNTDKGFEVDLSPFIKQFFDYSISENRTIPVEFDAMGTYELNVKLDIPEGYQLEKLPRQLVQKVEDNSLVFSFKSNVQNQTLLLHYKVTVSTLELPVERLTELLELNKSIEKITKCNFVLKKV